MNYKYSIIGQHLTAFALLMSLLLQSCGTYKSTKLKTEQSDTMISFVDKTKLDTQVLQSTIGAIKNKFAKNKNFEFFDINSGSQWCFVAHIDQKGYYIRIPWDPKHEIENQWSARGICSYGPAQTMRDLHIILKAIIDSCPGVFKLEFTNGPFGKTNKYIIYTGPESAKASQDPWGQDWWDADYGYDPNYDYDPNPNSDYENDYENDYEEDESYSVDASGVRWDDANDMYAYGDVPWIDD